jgi:hydroxymethylpyrimidine/phosphomethylpyrimidine kinase
MNASDPTARPVTLTIAGSDAGGGAGIQADIQTMAAHSAFATSALTAVTAQNTRGVESTHVLPPDEVAAQYEAVAEDFDLAAVKTGMLATAEIIETVTEHVRALDAPLVVDPVMVAESGDPLLEPEAERAYESLLAESTLVTPNVDETAVLVDIDPETPEDRRAAGEALLDLGADAALLKGGHAGGDPVTDMLVTESGVSTFEHARVDTDATHGSGCTLSSAITARLAHGDDLEAAVETATDFVQRAIERHYDVGHGPSPVNPMVDLTDPSGEHQFVGRAASSSRDIGAVLTVTLQQAGFFTYRASRETGSRLRVRVSVPNRCEVLNLLYAATNGQRRIILQLRIFILYRLDGHKLYFAVS